MAVAFKGIDGSTSKRGKRGARNYTRTIKIYTDLPPGIGGADQETEIYDALAALTPPIRIGQGHPVDGIALCDGIDLRIVKRHTSDPGTWEWQAVASYSSENKEPPNGDPNPANQIPKITTSNETRKIAAVEDVNLTAVANSSMEPIPWEQDQSLVVFDIELTLPLGAFDYRYCLDAKFDEDNGMVNSLNDDDFIIPSQLLPATNITIGTGEGLIRSIRLSPLRANGQKYVVATINILHDPNGHVTPLIDQGFMQLKTIPIGLGAVIKTVQIPILQGGTTPNVPRLLDGKGHPINPQTDDPFTLEFQFNPSQDWTWLQNILNAFSNQ